MGTLRMLHAVLVGSPSRNPGDLHGDLDGREAEHRAGSPDENPAKTMASLEGSVLRRDGPDAETPIGTAELMLAENFR